MTDIEKKKFPIGTGLNPTPPDSRDFSFGAVFGAVPLADLPQGDFFVSVPLAIKDQGDSDKCSAYALTAVSEDQEEIELSPDYQFAKTKQIMGEWESWGADLRSACKSAVDFGSITQFLFEETTRDLDPSLPPDMDLAIWLRNWKNWPAVLDKTAEKHKKKSYFKIDGPYDIFDNFRSALWQNRAEERSILTGCVWRPSWVNAPKGVIPNDPEQGGFGHAFKIYGQKVIDGTLYLAAQLSNGTQIGDGGKFYFSRETVNREFTFGGYTFKDMPAETAKELSRLRLSQKWMWLARLLAYLAKLI